MPKRGLPRSPCAEGSIGTSQDTERTEEGVTEPHANDVISGRGDTINRHPGNVQFRKLVEEKRRVYLSSHFKREKRLIAETIVATIKGLDPPGRFLSRDARTGLWFSIGEDRAREKASQALRENSKKIRAEIQQTGLLSKRENPNTSGRSNNEYSSSRPHASIHSRMEYSPSSGNWKPSQYNEQHHYPYPPAPTGPGWGYPYYYGYGPHQVTAPFPPPPGVFHPHVYPPPPAHLAGPVYGGYPDAVPDMPRQDYDQPQQGTRSVFKSIQTLPAEERLQHSEEDDHMDSSGSTNGTRRDEPQTDQEQLQTQEQHLGHVHNMASLKCRRIDALNEQAGERTANTPMLGDQKGPDKPQPTAFYLPEDAQKRHGFGQPPPAMPNLNSCDGSKSANEQVPQIPQKFKLARSSYPLKSPQKISSEDPILHANSSNTTHKNATTPEATVHKLAAQTSPPSFYAIKSPHNFRLPHQDSYQMMGASNHPDATLTPAAATCMAALDEILGSPADQHDDSTRAVGYASNHDSPPARRYRMNADGTVPVCDTTMGSPLIASPSTSSDKDPAVPFSPIRAAHLDPKGHPTQL